MNVNPVRRRLAAATLVAIALAAPGAHAQPGTAAQAAYAGPLFDAHLHYNVEAQERYPVADVLGRMQRSGVRAIVANSRPNDGTKALASAPRGRARQASPWCRSCASTATAPTTPAGSPTRASSRWCCASSPRGRRPARIRGLGEFHLYDSAKADGPTARRLMQLARAARAGGAGACRRRRHREALRPRAEGAR